MTLKELTDLKLQLSFYEAQLNPASGKICLSWNNIWKQERRYCYTRSDNFTSTFTFGLGLPDSSEIKALSVPEDVPSLADMQEFLFNVNASSINKVFPSFYFYEVFGRNFFIIN